MKRITSILVCLLFIGLSVRAQDIQITGKVTSAEDGSPLPGVSVVIQGTTTGTASNIDGDYSISAPSDAVLVFTSVGMETQEVPVGGQTVINVEMAPSALEMDEVVVTAFGISRDVKSLGYSVQQIESEEITKTSNRSALNALQGKVAGVNIASSSTQPGASTRVIIRGFSSIDGNNQPLYVVDGIPVNNSSRGLNDNLNGGVDFGNRANDINPDDIESINILKGSSATALYGSRAANGVIVITTKKGSLGQKTKIDINSSITWDTPLRLPQLQNQYGQGWDGGVDLLENTSWGPKFDGEERPWGHVVDNSQRLKDYKALETNVADFFDVGVTYNNSIALSGGSEKSTYRLSYSNVTSDGIFPTDADSYNRNTLTLSGSSQLTKRLRAESSFNYINKKVSAVPTGQEASTYNNIMQTPRDISIVEHEDYKYKFNNLDNYYSPYTQNPYYALNEHGNELNDDRVIGNVNLNYDFVDWLSATFRAGTDVANAQVKEWRAITYPAEGSYNEGVETDDGRVREAAFHDTQINTDFILNFNKTFGDIAVNLLAGHNYNYRRSKSTFTEVIGLDIPYFYDLSNSSSTPSTSSDDYFIGITERKLIGLYTNLDIAFRELLFVEASFRTDWASTLPENNRNYSYPAVNMGFVFTELLPSSTILTFGKLRAGWGRTGKEADPYLTKSVFIQGSMSDGFRNLNFPLPNAVNGFEVSNRIGNPELTHELSEEIEVGADLRFFTNRVGIDFTYYNRNITNQIYPVSIPFSSGYSSQVANIGKISNKGIELLVNLVPVRTADLRWDITLNFAKNDNELVELTEGLEKISLGGLSTITLVATPGEPLGLIEADEPLRDDQGRIVVGSNGIPIPASEKKIYGSVYHDWTAGVSTALSWKGISVSGLVDIRQGGIMYSRTADISHFAGIAPQTLYNDRQPFIVPNSVMEVGEDDEGNPIYGENTIPITYHGGALNDYWNDGGDKLDESFLLDKSFIKLREVAISYTIPSTITERFNVSRLTVGVVGRNLLIWTPEDQKFIDPEMSTFDDGLGLLAEYGEFSAAPTTRSYGFNIKLSF